MAQLQGEMLASHNRYRLLHNVSPLQLDEEVLPSISIKHTYHFNFQMNDAAQDRARMIVSEDKFQGGDTAFGENLLITNSRIVRLQFWI